MISTESGQELITHLRIRLRPWWQRLFLPKRFHYRAERLPRVRIKEIQRGKGLTAPRWVHVCEEEPCPDPAHRA